MVFQKKYNKESNSPSFFSFVYGQLLIYVTDAVSPSILYLCGNLINGLVQNSIGQNNHWMLSVVTIQPWWLGGRASASLKKSVVTYDSICASPQAQIIRAQTINFMAQDWLGMGLDLVWLALPPILKSGPPLPQAWSEFLTGNQILQLFMWLLPLDYRTLKSMLIRLFQ